MKKLFSFTLAVLSILLLASCEPSVKYVESPATETIEIPSITIDGSKDGGSWFFWSQNLPDALANQKVSYTFSCEMSIQNSVDEGYLMWQVNTNNNYPKLATCNFTKNDASFKTVSESGSFKTGNSAIFYLSNYNEPANTEFTNSNFKIQVKNLKLVINYTVKVPEGLSDDQYWLNVASLKDTFKNTGLEHIGIAVTGNELLSDAEKAKGLKYHASSITMGNEFKPDFLFAWQLNKNTPTEKFTDSYGTTIDVPVTLAGFENADKYLAKCKELGLKMRGHVLVWYSQTPKAFFCENYDQNSNFVKSETMTARQEWYIKTVLEHVKDWEKENMPEGEHLIYTWDVVNEAVADGSSSLRSESNSNWAKVYKDDNYEFIINAFRFANKYAPEDVLLAYNDYNEASGSKYQGYLKVLDEILAHTGDTTLPTRIDIAGMQSHNQPSYPSISEYETAIQSFINKGLDVQVTELDITGPAKDNTYQIFNAPSAKEQKATYKSYFELYLKYAKTEGKAHGVTGVTFWGINDQDSWRASGEPLLFTRINGKIYAKDAFYGVIEAKK